MTANPEDPSGARPGDEVAPENPDAGENVCPACAGSGRADGGECPDCRGSGVVAEGVGGG